jgi:hypothetical protein
MGTDNQRGTPSVQLRANRRFDTSGESLALIQDRKSFQTGQRKPVAGFGSEVAQRSSSQENSTKRSSPQKQFDSSGESLALFHHRKNRKARAVNRPRVFSFRTVAARHDATSFQALLPERRRRVAVRAIYRCARTRRRGPRSSGIGFAPEMIAPGVHAATFIHVTGEACMTAYLISLSLVGLIAIAVWEAFA